MPVLNINFIEIFFYILHLKKNTKYDFVSYLFFNEKKKEIHNTGIVSTYYCKALK